MALLHSDGFDSHLTGAATLADGDPNWGAQVGVTIDATAGKFGGKSLSLAAAATGSLAFVTAGVYLAFAGWFKVATSSNPVPLLADSTGALLTRNADGSLVVKDGAGTTRATGTAGDLPDGTYAWVEVGYRNGSIVVLVNSLPVATYTGAYTAPAYGAMKLLNSAGTGIGRIDVDDFIVWDDQGAYFNSFGIARRRIQLLRPSANGSAVAWVPNSGANWQAADDTDWSGGAGNVATAAGQKDRLAFTDMSVSPGLIDAAVVKTKQQNTGSDPATLTHVSATGVTEATGAAQAVSTVAPAVLRTPFYRDPTGAAWTSSTVNANEFGYTLGI